MKKQMTDDDKSDIIISISLIIIFVAGLIWSAFFSPWARYNPTEKELYEAAVQYDIKHGTDYASEMYNPNWYNDENE